MRLRRLFFILFLPLVASCSFSNRGSYTVSKTERLPALALSDSVALSVTFNVYDPISYSLELLKDSTLRITFYTHRVKDDRVIKRVTKFQNSKGQSFNWGRIRNLPLCNEDPDFECLGLGGSETWIRFKNGTEKIKKRYWLPSSQQESELGKDLLSMQVDIDSLFGIANLRSDFIGSLPRGRYWNYGGAEIKK